MAERDTSHQDLEVFEKTLQELIASGVDRRIAEGRARRAAAIAYRKVHGEPEREAKPAAERTHAGAAAGDGGGGNGGAAPAAAPAAAAVAAPPAGMYVPPPAAAVRTAPPLTDPVAAPKP